jgi:hypothetical protein
MRAQTYGPYRRILLDIVASSTRTALIYGVSRSGTVIAIYPVDNELTEDFMVVREFKKFSLVGLLALLAFAVLSTATVASAQGKGHGKGGGKHGGWGDKWERKAEKHEDKWERKAQKREDRWERREDRGGWGRQQQVWGDWNSRRAQWESDQRARRQQVWSDRVARRQQEWSDRRSRRDRDVYYGQQPWGGQWNDQYRNHGQRVSAERHRRNAERKAWKDQLKEQRRYQRDERRRYRDTYYNYNYNYAPRYYDDYQPRRSSVRREIIQNVIGNVIGSRLGGYQRYVPYTGYGSPYQSEYNYSPRYVQNQYYAPRYSPVYDNGADYYDYPQQRTSRIGTVLQALPLAEIVQQYTGGNDFLSSIVSNALPMVTGGSGYDAGYDDGYGDPYGYGYNDEQAYDGYEQTSGTGDLISMALASVLSGV